MFYLVYFYKHFIKLVQIMNISQVYMYYGGNWKLAMSELKMSPVCYTYWIRRGSIPFRSQLIIEKTTKGELKASSSDDIRVRQRAKAFNALEERAGIKAEGEDNARDAREQRT